MALILARKIRQYRSVVSILQQIIIQKEEAPIGFSRPQSEALLAEKEQSQKNDDELQQIFQQDRRCWYPSSVIIKPQLRRKDPPPPYRVYSWWALLSPSVQATSTS